MRPQSNKGLGEECLQAENTDTATFYTPVEAWVMLTHSSKKNPEEREFVVDSGASMQMLSKKEESSEEMGTVKRSRTPTVIVDCKRQSAHPRGGTGVRS